MTFHPVNGAVDKRYIKNHRILCEHESTMKDIFNNMPITSWLWQLLLPAGSHKRSLRVVKGDFFRVAVKGHGPLPVLFSWGTLPVLFFFVVVISGSFFMLFIH